MKLGDKYKDLYVDYYKSDSDSFLALKRQMTSDETSEHFMSFFKDPVFRNLADVGAGDGSTIQSLNKYKKIDEFSAYEISKSGIDEIKKLKIKNLTKIELFNGYEIPVEKDHFDIAIAAHVLEHVEHERSFLDEFSRISKMSYVEVPLENTLNVSKAIQIGEKYGHINFYNLEVLLNLIQSSGLKLIKHKIFQHSYKYEILISGKFRGSIKFFIKKIALLLSPKLATTLFAYTAGILFSKPENYHSLKDKYDYD